MTHHIVMFKFRNDVPSSARDEAGKTFKMGIEALPTVIPFIRSVQVGLNANAAEQWDICLTSTFDNLDDVRSYSAHPAHKAVATALMTHIAQRACVDFED